MNDGEQPPQTPRQQLRYVPSEGYFSLPRWITVARASFLFGAWGWIQARGRVEVCDEQTEEEQPATLSTEWRSQASTPPALQRMFTQHKSNAREQLLRRKSECNAWYNAMRALPFGVIYCILSFFCSSRLLYHTGMTHVFSILFY